MANNPDLAPCPFCGNIPRLGDSGPNSKPRYGITCDYCRAFWFHSETLTKNEVIKKWNHRVNLTELPYGPEDE